MPRMRSRFPGAQARPSAKVLAPLAAIAMLATGAGPLLSLMATASQVPEAAAVTEISPTIYLGGIQDLRPDSSGASKCTLLVDAAAGFGMYRRAQFLVSMLWWDSGPQDPAPGFDGCANYTLSTYYCFSRFNATSVLWWSYHRDPKTGTAAPVTQADVDEFRQLLTLCLQHAIDLGLAPAINVHIDDGRAENGWRNTLPFDPLQKLQGFSYYDILLAPIADALNAVLPAGDDAGEAWLSLQGEMGATVFFYPRQWVEVAQLVRDRLAQGRPELRDRVLLGLGINNSKLCGCVLIDIVNYDKYLAAFAPLWPSIEGWFDLEGIREAFTTVDYVGISAYVPQKRVDFQPCDMEGLMQKMDVEFAYYNLTLRELVFDLGKQIHWIEWGIGGGTSQNGDTPARTALEAAYYPFWGVGGRYDPAKDPWQVPDVRAYMLHYINMTSAYLLQGGCEYRVDGCYMWTVGGSWDVLGLYPTVSNLSGGSFRVEEAVDIIRAHNDEVHDLEGEPTASTPASGAPTTPAAAPATPAAGEVTLLAAGGAP